MSVKQALTGGGLDVLRVACCVVLSSYQAGAARPDKTNTNIWITASGQTDTFHSTRIIQSDRSRLIQLGKTMVWMKKTNPD